MFLESIWKPFEQEGRPEERLPAVRDAIERLRPLASEALLATFRLAMDDAIDAAFGRELDRAARRPRRVIDPLVKSTDEQLVERSARR